MSEPTATIPKAALLFLYTIGLVCAQAKMKLLVGKWGRHATALTEHL